MSSEKRNPVLYRLEVMQYQLLGATEDQLIPLATVLKETYQPQLLDAYGDISLRVRTLSSFVIEKAVDKERVWQFGELIHIGEICGLEFGFTALNARTLFVEFDAEFVAKPPGKEKDFDPFYKKVNMPIDSLAEIVPVTHE